MADPGIAAAATRAAPIPATAHNPGERRIPALDGFRGVATLMVIVSHYFGEVPHGIRALMVGWLAVDMFFVLSGFLIGKLIIERRHHANFFKVFYVRRFCRIIPAYVVVVLAIALIIGRLPGAWSEADPTIPLWAYLAFVQNVFMVTTHSIGSHWLAPTWTLAVEEHFYLLAPAAIVFTPRRWLVPVLVAVGVAAVGVRIAIYASGISSFAALVLLPGRADLLVCGLLAALAIKTPGIPWGRLIPALRLVPFAALTAAMAMYAVDRGLSSVATPLLLGVGLATYLLCIVLDTPEARRYQSGVLQFFGNNGYCLYLTHLPILGLMHGLLLGTTPDLVTPAQWAVTLAALPVCVLAGWGLTRLVEEPLIRFGRTWRWDTSLPDGQEAVSVPGRSSGDAIPIPVLTTLRSQFQTDAGG